MLITRPRALGAMRAFSTKPLVLGYGESMLRYAPMRPEGAPDAHGRRVPSAVAPFMRSVGGDELNVLVALARLGYATRYASVLPEGPLGAVVADAARDAGVDVDAAVRYVPDGGDALGTFTVLPEERRVHYQRAGSAFARAPAPGSPGAPFDWGALLGGVAWVHATGITPACGAGPRAHWLAHVDAARAAGARLSVDLNWRPQLGALEPLWADVLPAVAAPNCELLVLSLATVRPVGRLLGLSVPDAPTRFEVLGAPATGAPEEAARLAAAGAVSEDDPAWGALLADIARAIGAPGLRVACCFKTRDLAGDQTRWSVLATADGAVASSRDAAIVHAPRDECGGGSAWAAGASETRSRRARARR